MNEFTHLFLFAIFIHTGIHLWLTVRQEQHIRNHSNQVPDAFADKIKLDAHQKAADYNIANLQHERAGIWLGTVMLLFGP